MSKIGFGPKRKITFDEDASELRFPEEFKDVETLFIAEVRALLSKRLENNYDFAIETEDMPEVFKKTKQYCDQFTTYKDPDTIQAIRQMLEQQHLHKFEVAQFANLLPNTAQEAKTLIPSIESRFTDEVLQDLIDAIQHKLSYTNAALD
ncbi:hypothetical protein SNEBB_001919 [Seison nebaliae]|nr:hypothetical protein SNEBB_001919 [Seison nebaliae]